MKTTEQLYDVVIYEIETSRIDTIVGKEMKKNTGFYNAEKRVATTLERINNNYSIEIVEAGKYKKGDILNGS